VKPSVRETSGPLQVIPLSDPDDPSAATFTLSWLPTSPSVSVPVQLKVSPPVPCQLTRLHGMGRRRLQQEALAERGQSLG
jgi:hypothetical protein